MADPEPSPPVFSHLELKPGSPLFAKILTSVIVLAILAFAVGAFLGRSGATGRIPAAS
jgi:hypothetical protein